MNGINGSALKWLKSYILNISSSEKFCDFSSDHCPLLYGVPQGSILGPLLLSIYIENIRSIISKFLSFSSHIANISKAANYHLFRIRCIRKHITRPLCAVLINSLVISRIDYCSSLLYFLSASSIAPLNRIIRSSIRSIVNIKLSDHSSTDSLYQTGFPIENDP